MAAKKEPDAASIPGLLVLAREEQIAIRDELKELRKRVIELEKQVDLLKADD